RDRPFGSVPVFLALLPCSVHPPALLLRAQSRPSGAHERRSILAYAGRDETDREHDPDQPAEYLELSGRSCAGLHDSGDLLLSRGAGVLRGSRRVASVTSSSRSLWWRALRCVVATGILLSPALAAQETLRPSAARSLQQL